jgi:hypothetical protein
MKRIFFIVMITCLIGASYAQNCDIAQTGVAIYNASNSSPVASVAAGENANFKFSIANLGTQPSCSIPASSVTAVFNLPTTTNGTSPYVYDGPTSFTSGYFSWTYNSTNNTLVGTNVTAIPNGTGDANVLVKVKGASVGTASSSLTLTQNGGLSNNTGNDYSSAQLKVTTGGILPIKLASFTIIADQCNAVLNWATVSEDATFSYFGIEYSTDGTTFTNVGTVNSKNQVAGAKYDFTYFQVSGNGYYRLKQVDKDGSFEYSTILRVVTTCTEKGKLFLYPNPVNYNQKVELIISGYAGKIEGQLFNAIGQKIAGYTFSNGKNEISVVTFAPGTYALHVWNNGSEDSYKIIVTR